MQRRVDYYFTLYSPWAYLGHDIFMDMAERHDLDVRFMPVNLARVFPETGGVPFAKRAPARLNYRLVELQRWRDKRELPLTVQPAYFPTDPTLADCCALALLDEGHDPSDFMHRTYRAVWVQDKNISDDHVLEGILSDCGFETHRILAKAHSDAIIAAYAANADAAVAAGVFGSPAYVYRDEVFWGQDRLELLEDALISGRLPYHP